MAFDSSVNKVFLVGNVETPPRKHTRNGIVQHLAFTLSTREAFMKGKAAAEHTEFHELIISPELMGAEAELKKGELLHITGKVSTRSWLDAGQVRRYKTEILVAQLVRLGR